MKMLSPEV
jgi:hypothetical protein